MQEMHKSWVRSLGLENHWRRKWQPTAVSLPEKTHGQKSLAGYSPWGRRVRRDYVTDSKLYVLCCAESLSRVRLFVTPWTVARQASWSITNSQSLLKLMSIESMMPSNHLILSSPSPPAFDLCQHQGLFN